MMIHRRRSRFIAGVATALPAFLLAGLLALPGASWAGEGGGSGSASGTVPPGGSITTVDGPIDANDPFAVALKNIGDETLDVTIEEEPCDGTQEGDPLCSEPRVGGVAGDFIYEESGSESESAVALVESGAIVIAKLFYDRSVVQNVDGFRMFYQKTSESPVIRLPRCERPILTDCVKSTRTKRNGDQVVQVKLSEDPRVTRG